MDFFELQKFIEIVLFILNKTKGVTIYQLNKLLYFAEMKHLATWGVPFIPDTFQAWKLGPVPRNLYMALKHINKPEKQFTVEIAKNITLAGEDAPSILIAKRVANMDYLSETAIASLEDAIANYSHLSFAELKEKSHDSAWKEARNKGENQEISRVSMARVITDNTAILDYIKYTLELQEAFRDA